MADTAFNSVAEGIVGKIFGSILWFGVAILLIGVIGFCMWYFIIYRKKFDILVKVKSERAGDRKVFFDHAAILYDRKDKIKYLRLRDTKYDLPAPPYGIITHTNKGDYMEIWRKSEDDFIYLAPGKIDQVNVLKQDGRLIPIGITEQKQIEGDVAYWNTKRKEKNRNLFNTEGLFMKLLPFIPQIVAGVLTIFIIYILMDSLPAILTKLQSLADSLKDLKGGEAVPAIGLLWIKRTLNY